MKKITEGDYSANTARFAIVVARFNEFIVDGLQQGALETLGLHAREPREGLQQSALSPCL